MAKQTIYNAGIYVRLSQEDMRAGASLSIENQKKLLTKAAKDMGYTNLVTFVDDGVSGVTMNRPRFNAMIAELEKGHASAVFVKDYCVINARTSKPLENRHFLRNSAKFRATYRPQRTAYHIGTS